MKKKPKPKPKVFLSTPIARRQGTMEERIAAAKKRVDALKKVLPLYLRVKPGDVEIISIFDVRPSPAEKTTPRALGQYVLDFLSCGTIVFDTAEGIYSRGQSVERTLAANWNKRILTLDVARKDGKESTDNTDANDAKS